MMKVKSASVLLWSTIHNQMAWADFTVHFFGYPVEILKQ